MTFYKSPAWQLEAFANYLIDLDVETHLDLDLATLDQLKDEFPDEWAQFAVLEGI